MLPALEQPDYFPQLHAALCVEILYWLAPRLPEAYQISVEQGLSMSGPGGKAKRYRPDARIDRVESPSEAYVTEVAVDTPSFTVEAPSQPQRTLAIREGDGRLITTIEILSPANKAGDGYEAFRLKQQQLSEQRIHLVEIDLQQRELFWQLRRLHLLVRTFADKKNMRAQSPVRMMLERMAQMFDQLDQDRGLIEVEGSQDLLAQAASQDITHGEDFLPAQKAG